MIWTWFCWNHRDQIREVPQAPSERHPSNGGYKAHPRCPVCCSYMNWVPNGGGRDQIMPLEQANAEYAAWSSKLDAAPTAEAQREVWRNG
jgi:hypothetical protein